MIIDRDKIETLLQNAGSPSDYDINHILKKALELKGLSLEEIAVLLNAGAQKLPLLQGFIPGAVEGWGLEEVLAPGGCEGGVLKVLKAAGQVKDKVFGRRVVLFAPLYLSNECVNNCLYCGFRVENKQAVRKTLTVEEAVKEAKALVSKGYKRLLLVAAENPAKSSVDYILDVVKAIYSETDIRILHLNAAPMPVGDLRRLKDAGVGVFQVFQETYHRETYEKMHPSGMKRGYDYRLSAMDRAIEAGVDDLGIGALLGLYDWRFDLLATVSHAHYLKEKYGIWPHTISVPRLRPASGSPLTSPPFPVSDEEFKLIVALYRLAVPTAGVVVSTRESAELRREVLSVGASQISAGSRTEPGGYDSDEGRYDASQFDIDDNRSLDEVIEDVARLGYMPSLCTSCYRVGRTGKDFHELAGSGNIKDYCSANAILTLKEYILDSANGSRAACKESIRKEIEGMTGGGLKEGVKERLLRVEAGERDLFY